MPSLKLLLQRWSGTDRNIHCPGQAVTAHSGPWVCGHPRARVRNEIIPDVYGADRGRTRIYAHFHDLSLTEELTMHQTHASKQAFQLLMHLPFPSSYCIHSDRLKVLPCRHAQCVHYTSVSVSSLSITHSMRLYLPRQTAGESQVTATLELSRLNLHVKCWSWFNTFLTSLPSMWLSVPIQFA